MQVPKRIRHQYQCWVWADICGSRQACRLEPRVAISPTPSIYEVLGSREQRALTDLIHGRRIVHFMLQPLQQALHNPGWDAGLLGRVDKTEEDEIMQEHPPERPEAIE